MKSHICKHENRNERKRTRQARRPLSIRRCALRLTAGAALLLHLCAPAHAATVRWAGSSNRIYVEGGGSVTLTDIKTALPNAPLDLVDATNQIWLLRANLFVTDDCTLSLHGTSVGGHVNELRLLSYNSGVTNSVVSVDADAGTLDLNGTRITSWDPAVNGPDTEYAVYQRAFIRARSRQVGTTNQESTLNVVNSDIGYLGFEDAESYGLTWQVVSSVAGVRVFGNVSGSHIHHCQLGVSTWSADDVNWTGNEIAFNTLYGFDPNDSGHQTVVANNNVHDNTYGATFRFSGASNRIYVEGGGSATLTDIKNALPNAPLDLVDAANQVWLLRANLFITDGSTLILHGSAAGGDVNEFRLQSNNSSASNSFVNVTADHGEIDINDVHILSWDSAVNGPDTEYQAMGRAFIRVRAKLASDGVTPLESRMNILNSDISYLGFDASESYGLSWKVIGTHPDPSKSIFDVVNVYGNIISNRIHDSFWGVYSYGLEGGQWLNNEIDHNAGYGFDPHDDSDHLVIEGNNVHHNGGVARGTHGIIASRRCDHLVIRNNRSWANAENGIMLHRHSDDCVVENNLTYLNGDSGIALFDVDRTTVRNNTVLSNANAGIRLTIGCADNVIANNEIGYSGANGLMIIPGNDAPEPDPLDPIVTSRNRRNSVLSNHVHDCQAEGLKLTDGDTNVFFGNVFARNLPKLSFTTSAGTQFISNSLPADVTVRLTGSTSVTDTIFFKQQAQVNLSLADVLNAATFQDDGGAIFDFDPHKVATHVDTTGSSVTVTSSEIGTGTTVITRNLSVQVADGSQPPPASILVNPTIWEAAGDLRKAWTTQSPDSATTLVYTVGDLAPDTAYSVLKYGQLLLLVQSDSTGRISFSDAPGTNGAVEYAVAPGGPLPPPIVSVTASDANASESGSDPGVFTVTRTGDATAALTVNYWLSGSAANGSDYSTLSGSVTIPSGTSSGNVTVSPIDDATVEGNETVLLTLAPDPAYSIGPSADATVTIVDDDQPPPLPTVTVVANAAGASESGPDSGRFIVNRSGDTTTALTVTYSLGGSAVNGSDYSTLSGSATILAGSSSVKVTVSPIDDNAVEGNETVVLTVSSNSAYTVGSPYSATVTIADNDQSPPPTVSVIATVPVTLENSSDPGIFTVSRIGSIDSVLTVHYSLSGTAINNTDYQSLAGSVTIPGGATSANVEVRPIDDNLFELPEMVILTLTADPAYDVLLGLATVTIVNNDLLGGPLLAISLSGDAGGGSGGTVNLSWNAAPGSQYQLQYTTDLNAVPAAPELSNWINLGAVITATNETVLASDAIGSDSQRFYRAVQLP